jgi:hypothetical protein
MFRFMLSSQDFRRMLLACLAVCLVSVSPVRTDAAGTLYWRTTSLMRASTDGACRQVIQPNAGALVAVDPEGGKVYYYSSGAIRRCDFDGGNSEFVVQGPAGSFAIDRINRKLYWHVWNQSQSLTQIMRSCLDGSDIEQVFVGLTTGSSGIAVDPSAAKCIGLNTLSRHHRA